MSQEYSDPTRATDPHALPDVEVFFMQEGGDEGDWKDEDGNPMEQGWYWWSCVPGCLPDGDPSGPFQTEAEALTDAQDI